MKVKVKQPTEGKYGAPVGKYRAKFIGVEEREPMEGSDYGPGLEWKFQIVEGEQAGHVVTRTTALEPSQKNSCGRFLAAVTDLPISPDMEVELSDYVGKVYQIKIEPNSKNTGTRVADVPMLLEGVQAPALPPPQRQAAAPPPPPPPPRPPVAPKPPAANGQAGAPPPKFWVQTEEGKDAQLMDGPEVQQFLMGSGKDPAAVLCMTEDQSSGWKSATDFGLAIPF